MSSRDEVPCWSIRPKMNKNIIVNGARFKRGYIDHRAVSPYWTDIFCSSEGTSTFESWVPIEPFKRGYIGHWVVSPYWTIMFCSSEGISTIESWVPIEPLCFVQARVYRPLSRESLLNYYITGTKKRKTLLGRAPPVQARVNQRRVVSHYCTVTLLVYLW